MAAASSKTIRRCYRVADSLISSGPQFHSRGTVTLLQQSRAFSTTQKTFQLEESIALRTRLIPASASYYNANPEYCDNILALEELLRKHETLPTVPGDQTPQVKWKTLIEYRDMIGGYVKPSRYNRVSRILNRLNRIEPSLLPQETKEALEPYKHVANEHLNIPRPRTVDGLGRAYGCGRRKTSVARVYVVEGNGEVMVNGKPIMDVFPRLHDRESALWPLLSTSRMDKYNVWAVLEGGGTTGQAEALTLGLAKALLVHEPALKAALRRAGCVTRDPRGVERKKPGHLKARKMPTWVKR
ncbi:ribosomal protein S5 domain 2-type protein [Morchella snyderi]|nr:ribosomal protein S5 domain 2-type protein [Morchella snyderi]